MDDFMRHTQNSRILYNRIERKCWNLLKKAQKYENFIQNSGTQWFRKNQTKTGSYSGVIVGDKC